MGVHLIHIGKAWDGHKGQKNCSAFELAMLDRHVINIQLIFVLLSAVEIVKLPMSSLIMGENMSENMSDGQCQWHAQMKIPLTWVCRASIMASD